MRKKFVSLALTLALALSLAVPALAAEGPAFTDETDIQHIEAATALCQLGVMTAGEDGAFDPAGAVTRAEGARLITLIMNGGRDIADDDFTKTEPSFPDIGGHEAEAYIEYCADLGIVFAGADGKFDPDGDLTGFELLRMALAALGYDAKAFGLVTPDWKDRTDELVKHCDPSLYTDLLGFNPNDPITRDNAAQILFNALLNTPKVIVPRPNSKTGKVQWEYATSEKILLQERFGVDSWLEFSREEAPQDAAVQTPTFTDAADIQHPEAVAALVKWGILRGKEDSSYFDPAGAITRAQAAKVICLVMNGGEDLDGQNRKAPFSDCEGHWAEEYIAWCAEQGVIAGTGGGAFAPDNQVTGFSFVKMCLTMLGYDADACQLTGESWAVRADELARRCNPSLYADLSGFKPGDPITRDNAAQMLYNALQNKTGDKTFLQERFGLDGVR